MAPTPPKSNPSLPAVVSKSPRAELSFTIQFLSGRAVVMVECPGYDTELFIPQIVKDRITLQNIMLNRWCCSESSLTTYPTVQPVSSPPVRAPKRMISSTLPPPRGEGFAGKTKAFRSGKQKANEMDEAHVIYCR
ncbi:uncharacterized protein LOC117190500 [Drosophila miranda]|uniref:uncharacterized protein LOC117190500 n=1 Tax=Drosophila miranda TaxID=7229 RepID=UPI00143F8581|nr:uncharacterized protein LOC117190500 [Drosophila miranda]